MTEITPFVWGIQSCRNQNLRPGVGQMWWWCWEKKKKERSRSAAVAEVTEDFLRCLPLSRIFAPRVPEFLNKSTWPFEEEGKKSFIKHQCVKPLKKQNKKEKTLFYLFQQLRPIKKKKGKKKAPPRGWPQSSPHRQEGPHGGIRAEARAMTPCARVRFPPSHFCTGSRSRRKCGL